MSFLLLSKDVMMKYVWYQFCYNFSFQTIDMLFFKPLLVFQLISKTVAYLCIALLLCRTISLIQNLKIKRLNDVNCYSLNKQSSLEYCIFCQIEINSGEACILTNQFLIVKLLLWWVWHGWSTISVHDVCGNMGIHFQGQVVLNLSLFFLFFG